MREAATVGDAARIRELGARDKSRVNAFGDDGFHPLGHAAFFKRPEAVRALLDLGADARLATRPAAFTPLHSAVADDTGQAAKEIVRMLLAAGADPNARSASGGTPLHTAAFTGDVVMVRLLVAAGADPSIEDEKGRTPLDLARERNQTEAAALLHDAVLGRRG
jgi:ankyrin repeat protein